MSTVLTPDVGSPVLPTDPITFDVTDALQTLTALLISVRHDTGVIELAHDGVSFTSFYSSGSTRSVITNGYRFSLVRAGGWTDAKVVISAYPFAGTGVGLINFSSDFGVLSDPPGEDVSLSVTGATAGSFGNASHVATFTVDSKGRLTASSETAIILSDNSSTAIAHLGSGGATATNAANIGDVTAAVGAEATARAAADTTLTTNLAAETAARIAGDTAAISAAESFATAAVAAEATARAAADTTLTTNLAAETAARIAADSAEATTRGAADATLTTNLATETTARIAGDATAATNLATETAARIAGDATAATNLAAETAARIAADAAEVTARNAAIAVETSARIAADLLIPGTITALTGDVTAAGTGAVVATLANLPQSVLFTRLAALSADPAFNGHKLTNGADGTNPTDFTTLRQLTASVISFEVDEVADLEVLTFPTVGLILAKVETFEDLFYLDRGNTQTADGVTIVQASTGVGRWVRMNISNVIWQSQTAWYWDPIGGSDENSGAIGFPVKTHAEIERRCGTGIVKTDTTIHILNNATEVPVIRRTSSGTTGGEIAGTAILYYTCTPTPMVVGPAGALTGTVTAVTAENRNTNTDATVTVGGFASASDWTNLGLVKHFVRFSRLGTPVATTFIDADLGAKTARVAGLSNVTDAPQFCFFGAGAGPGTIQVGDTFQVLSRVSVPPPFIPNGHCTVYHGLSILPVSIGALNIGSAVGPGQFYENICETTGGVAGLSAGNCALYALYCYFGGLDCRRGTVGRLNACLFGGLTVRDGQWDLIDVRVGAGGCVLHDYRGGETASDVGVWDSNTGILASNSRLIVNNFWGKNNGGLYWSLDISGNGNQFILVKTPVIVNSAGDLRLNGVSHTWAEALPIGDISTQNFIMNVGA